MLIVLRILVSLACLPVSPVHPSLYVPPVLLALFYMVVDVLLNAHHHFTQTPIPLPVQPVLLPVRHAFPQHHA